VQCKVLAVLEAMVTASPGGWLRRDGDVVTVLREGLEQRLVEDARVGAANPQNARQMLLHAINGFWAPHEGTTKVSLRATTPRRGCVGASLGGDWFASWVVGRTVRPSLRTAACSALAPSA